LPKGDLRVGCSAAWTKAIVSGSLFEFFARQDYFV